MPKGGQSAAPSLSSLGFRRVHVGAHYRYQTSRGKFVSADRVDRTRDRAVYRAMEAEARAIAEREASRLARALERERESRRTRAGAGRPAPVSVRPSRRREPPAPPARPPRRAEVPPARGFRPVPPSAPRPPSVEPRSWDLVAVRGSFVRYRDRDSGRYVSKELYKALPPALRDTLRREVFSKTTAGSLGVRVKPLERFLLTMMRMGLTWDQIGDQYRADAVRLSLV